jgi:hypothetical protein
MGHVNLTAEERHKQFLEDKRRKRTGARLSGIIYDDNEPEENKQIIDPTVDYSEMRRRSQIRKLQEELNPRIKKSAPMSDERERKIRQLRQDLNGKRY